MIRQAPTAKTLKRLGLRHTVELLEAILDSLPDHIFVKDQDGAVLLANEACARAHGLTKEGIAGLPTEELFPPEQAALVRAHDRRVMQTGVPHTLEEQLEIGGKTLTYVTTKAPRRGRRGRVMGVFGIARDVTERKSLEEALRRSMGELRRHRDDLETLVMERTVQLSAELDERRRAEVALVELKEQLAQAQAFARIGSWHLNLRTGEYVYSDEALRILGIAKGFRGSYVGVVHRDDRKNFDRFVSGSPGFRKLRTERFRIIRASDGMARTIECTAQVRKRATSPVSQVGALRDVTELEAAKQAEAAVQRESLQREFVANVSHDLCTPIAAIKGYVETLLAGVPDQRTRTSFLKTVERQVALLEELVTDLLVLTSLEAGRDRAAAEPIELAPFALEQVETVAPIAARARVSIQSDIPSGLRVLIPRQHLARVFHNLLSNAIKYNRREGRVELFARADDGRVRMTVRDSGMGIPKDEIPLLFDRFFRTREARKHCGGTGLGLSIVKAVVEKAKGRISVESTEGRGTAFHIILAGA